MVADGTGKEPAVHVQKIYKSFSIVEGDRLTQLTSFPDSQHEVALQDQWYAFVQTSDPRLGVPEPGNLQ